MPTRGQIQELTTILEDRGIEFTPENGTKHDRILYMVGSKNYCITLSRGSKETEHRAHLNNLADVMRIVKDVPILQTKTNGAARFAASKLDENQLFVKFGIRSNGMLVARFKIADLNKKFKILPRATIKLTPSGLSILDFDPVVGILPQVHKNTAGYYFSRSKVPFEYGNISISSSLIEPVKATFMGNNQLVTELFPQKLLPGSQDARDRREIPEKKEEENQEFIFPKNLTEHGKAVKELFNEWLRLVEKSGSSADIQFGDNQIEFMLTLKI